MKIQLIKSDWRTLNCDALIIPLFEDDDFTKGFPHELDQQLDGLLNEMTETEEWKSKVGEIKILYRPGRLKTPRLILLGAGNFEAYDSGFIRDLIRKAVRKIKSYDLKKVAVFRRSRIEPILSAQATVEGILLATHDSDDYKTENKSKTYIEEIVFTTDQDLDSKEVEQALHRGEILAQATNLARQLVNEPGNYFSPTKLAETAKEVAENNGLEIEILDEPEMEKRKMGAILSVSRGSDEPGRFIILRHFGDPQNTAPPAVLIGKGVTFDSGGLSLKPANSMEEMKADKAGACAVLSSMQAIAQLQTRKNVVGLIPAVENLPSGRAQRPGDVVRSMSGKTIEIINTDAEGRLILADALHYGRQLNPEFMIDIATLTGACVVALGHLRAGLFSNNEDLSEKLLAAAECSGEKFWRLPLDPEYRKEIESPIADIKNCGSRWGGAITAAKFLQEFVGDTPWCHIDMAGVDLFKSGEEKGPTGFGVLTLVKMVAEY